jgi:cellulose binding protein with CBM10 domain
MALHWRTSAFLLPLASAALLSACSGNYEVVDESDADTTTDIGDEDLVDDDAVVLGTSWQALSYPTCMSAAADPDGDGWGWELNRSCVVNKAAGSAYPACFSTFSDPDRDGFGWEYNRMCVVKPGVTAGAGSTSTGSTGAGSTGGTTGGSTGSTGSSTGASCPNMEGTASTMAALAVAAAMEIGRWQPSKDFTIGKQANNEEILILTAGAKARCSDGACGNTQALLDFQKNEASGKVVFPGNVLLNSAALRSRLVAKYRDQVGCEMQPSNGGTTNCPVEEHTLTFQRSEKGGCDTNFFFVARKPDGSPLQFPGQLKNKLLWADRTNPYIGFQSVGEVVSIDPTFGLNDRGSTTTGACTAACVKIGFANVAGACCSCNGSAKTFRRSVWSALTYICQ